MTQLPLGVMKNMTVGENTNHCGVESTQDEMRKNVANSDLESASGDCLTCSDTEKVAIRTA